MSTGGPVSVSLLLSAGLDVWQSLHDDQVVDPLTVLVSALALGAAAGLKQTASTAVADAYSSLKRLLLRRHPEIDLDDLEQESLSNEQRDDLEQQLVRANIDVDAELSEAIGAVLQSRDAEISSAAEVLAIDLSDVRAAALRISDVVAGRWGNSSFAR
ncbi:MAG: hypothetical protein WKF73_18800 [Nocardioidaceae bacterium]